MCNSVSMLLDFVRFPGISVTMLVLRLVFVHWVHATYKNIILSMLRKLYTELLYSLSVILSSSDKRLKCAKARNPKESQPHCVRERDSGSEMIA